MIVVVALNFRAVDRDQQFLMPPSMAEWLPEDHLAWFVIDVRPQTPLANRVIWRMRADERRQTASTTAA